jgi:uncharacterized membrane protein YcaP (DUF421 family)
MNGLFYTNWEELARILTVGVLGYTGLVLILRISGKRTLSKMNAFDLVVTIALGSTLATVILSKDTSLAGGLLALALLVALQFVITWLSVRSERLSHLVKAEPTLLFYRGRFLQSALRSERVKQAEVLAAVREQGSESLHLVEAVVLETDGSFSVIQRSTAHGDSSLRGVKGYP